MASLVIKLVFYLITLHACSATTHMVWDEEDIITHTTDHQLSTKDVKTSATDQNYNDYAKNVVQLDSQKISAVNIEGNKVKLSYSRKMLQPAMVEEIWKGAQRRALESPPSNAEETVNSNDNDSIDDVVVMDYAQPHRKPPIHNKET